MFGKHLGSKSVVPAASPCPPAEHRPRARRPAPLREHPDPGSIPTPGGAEQPQHEELREADPEAGPRWGEGSGAERAAGVELRLPARSHGRAGMIHSLFCSRVYVKQRCINSQMIP